MKRRFLIAHFDQRKRDALAKILEGMDANTEFTFAADGNEAGFKLSNVPHQIAFLAADLPKQNGHKVTTWLLKEKKLEATAVIILTKIPDEEHFVEAVVSGRVQFADPEDGPALEKSLARALTYAYHGDKNEFSLRFLASGETLMKEGEKAQFCYLLKKGRLRAVRIVEKREVFLGFIDHGEFVGEMAYINHEPRSADVLAESASELIEIPFERLDHVLFQRPLWSKALLRTLTKRLKVANDYRADEDE